MSPALICEGIFPDGTSCSSAISEREAHYTKSRYGKQWCFNCQKTNPFVQDEIKKIQAENNARQLNNPGSFADKFPQNQQKQAPKQSSDKWQDDMVNFEQLLNDAHEKYNTDTSSITIETQPITIDVKEKYALFKAKVKINDTKRVKEMVFEAHGDADQTNVGKMIQPHYIRMAETRAIARALRWATNNATTAEEEKGPINQKEQPRNGNKN